MMVMYSTCVFAQSPGQTLEQYSQNFNQQLPMDYDPLTKLVSTRVENNEMIFNFSVIPATSVFDWSLSKARAEALRNICQREAEDTVLGEYNANVVYHYRAVTGETIGKFTVKPDPCK